MIPQDREDPFTDDSLQMERRNHALESQVKALTERVRELESRISAMHYGDSLLLGLLEEKGVKVEAINLGIESLAEERDDLKAQLTRSKDLLSRLWGRDTGGFISTWKREVLEARP